VRAFLRARDRRATITRRVLARSDLDGDDLTTIDLSVRPGDSLSGRTLAELNLPHEAIVTSLVRNGRAMIPRGRVVLQPGDQLQITTLASARDLVMAQVTANRGSAEVAFKE
jgi:Trk K+ transport system NAD-binding subunit